MEKRIEILKYQFKKLDVCVVCYHGVDDKDEDKDKDNGYSSFYGLWSGRSQLVSIGNFEKGTTVYKIIEWNTHIDVTYLNNVKNACLSANEKNNDDQDVFKRKFENLVKDFKTPGELMF